MGDEEIKDKYQEIKDKLTYKEFLEEIQEIKDENETAFLTEAQAVEMVLTKYQDITNKPLTTPNQITQIVDLIDGNGNINIQGRLLKISNTKVFTTKKGREGKVANLTVADKTGQIRVVLWTDNIKYINRIQEGDIIKIKNLEVKTGYTGDLEVQMRNNSSIQVMPEEVDETLPEFSEKITNLQDITEEGEYTVIVRITKISGIQTIPHEDKELTLVNLDIMDKTGHTQLTLWNNDTKLVEELDLKVNDSIKIIGARCRLRNNEPSLSNSWNGRIIKGDYDVPEYKEEITKLGNAQEQDNAIILGIITKIYDTITFERDNGTEGKVRSIEVTDDTGEIRVTLWNENTEIQMEKGNIIKISGGTIEDDTYSNEAYRLNTGWDALIQINPSIDPELKEKLEKITSYQSVPIENVLDVDIEEGREVDVIGRILSIDDIREFQRVDGTEGKVRSIDLSDTTGTVKTSLWDEKTELKEKLGDAIKIENARTRLGQGNMELSVGKTSRITNPNNEELEKIGTYEELENLRYKDRTIDQLVENEKDSKIKARILKVNDVNKFIRNDDSTGQVRSIEIADNTGIVQITLWDKDTEKIFHENEAVIIENPSI